MAHIVVNIRQVMLIGQWHPAGIDIVALLSSVIVLLCGRWFFNRCSPRFEDFL